MGWAILLVIELVLLKTLQKQVYGALAAGKMSLGAKLIAAPGVIVHELAHYIMAVILFVPRGRVRLFSPETQPDGSVVFGYVETYYTDPLRHSLVSLAPVLLLPPAYAGILYQTWTTSNPAYMAIALFITLLTAPAAFPSPGDKPGFFGWIAFIGLIVFASYVMWPLTMEIFMPLALIYGPAALSSAIILASLRS